MICKNCAKEYSEDSNFNWSCRTHHSEFSGEMWWCCGKVTKEALGCKYRKHISRNENEEDEVEAIGDNDDYFSKIKCNCCHQMGHRELNCPNDPNFRTSVIFSSVDKE